MYTIICAWCGKVMRSSGNESPVSYLICTPCFDTEMKREKVSKPRFYPPNPPAQAPDDKEG